MTFQYGLGLRCYKLNSINKKLGSAAVLRIFSGAEPENCQCIDPAGLLVWINLPTPPFKDAVNGTISLNGLWAANAGDAGEAQSFRIYDSEGICEMQGNCSTDLIVNNNNIKPGQLVVVSSFNITEGNE